MVDGEAVTGDELNRVLAAVSLEQLRAARPDLIEAILAESSSRQEALESELDRRRAQDAALERRATAIRLLAEFKLPDPERADAAGKALVSQRFLETLLAAPDERTMRTLVEERAAVVAAARSLDRGYGGAGRPLSREQSAIEPRSTVHDAKSFARAIS
jgi:hypothetical protein